jgi:hypothetical protein
MPASCRFLAGTTVSNSLPVVALLHMTYESHPFKRSFLVPQLERQNLRKQSVPVRVLLDFTSNQVF